MNNKNSIAAFLAIMAMLGFLIIFAALGWSKVPAENKDFFNMGFIALIGFVGTAFGYYLGSSLGSAQKNELLAQATAPPETPPGSDTRAAGFVHTQLIIPMGALMCGLLAMTLIYGCATTGTQQAPPQITAGKTLLAVKATIVTAATAVDALCAAQKMTADNCAKAKAAYELAKPAYDTAVDAYLIMIDGGDPAAYGAALTNVQAIATNLQLLTGKEQ